MEPTDPHSKSTDPQSKSTDPQSKSADPHSKSMITDNRLIAPLGNKTLTDPKRPYSTLLDPTRL